MVGTGTWVIIGAVALLIGVIYMRNRNPTRTLGTKAPMVGGKDLFFDEKIGIAQVISAIPNGHKELTVDMKLKTGEGWEMTYLTETLRPLDPVRAVCGHKPITWTAKRWNEDNCVAAKDERAIIRAEARADNLKGEIRNLREHGARDTLEILETALRGRSGGTTQPKPPSM